MNYKWLERKKLWLYLETLNNETKNILFRFKKISFTYNKFLNISK